MPVNILNLPGLNVLDFKETDDEYHIKASPREITRRCLHCNKSDDIVSHAWRTLVIRDIPSHGKAVAIHLDVPRLKCRPCKKTFTSTVPEVDTGREMTMRLTQWIDYEIQIKTRVANLGADLSILELVFDSGKF